MFSNLVGRRKLKVPAFSTYTFTEPSSPILVWDGTPASTCTCLTISGNESPPSAWGGKGNCSFEGTGRVWEPNCFLDSQLTFYPLFIPISKGTQCWQVLGLWGALMCTLGCSLWLFPTRSRISFPCIFWFNYHLSTCFSASEKVVAVVFSPFPSSFISMPF